jgi:hypothetical protein
MDIPNFATADEARTYAHSTGVPTYVAVDGDLWKFYPTGYERTAIPQEYLFAAELYLDQDDQET